MSETVTIGHPPIEVRLKRHARAKRLTLRLSQVSREATLTLPPRTPLRQARAFALKQEQWLREQMARLPERALLTDGAEIPFRGESLILRTASGKSVRLSPPHIEVATPNPARRLRAFFRTEARNAILPLVEHYSSRIGRPFNRVTLRDTRSRWGSCSGEGNLMFSWRLVMAPPRVLEYVVAHEVAHLVEMNHSAAFWAQVETLMPDYRNHRHWLRSNGANLHAVDFGA